MKWFMGIAGVCVISLWVVFTQFPTGVKSEAEVKEEAFVPNDKMRENVETYWEIMRAAVYKNVTTDKAADYREDMEWFAGFVKERSERFGDLKSIDEPTYSGPGDAAIVVRFASNAYLFNLELDNNSEITNINLTNYAPEESLSNLSWEELGDDTLRATVLSDLSLLKTAFSRDRGKVRLVSILSPT